MPKHGPPLRGNRVIICAWQALPFLSIFRATASHNLAANFGAFHHRILGKILLCPQAHRLLRSFLQIPLPCHLHRAPSPYHTPSARLWPHHGIHRQGLPRPIHYTLHIITSHSRTPRYFRHATCAQALSAPQNSQADIALPALHNPSALVLSPAHAPATSATHKRTNLDAHGCTFCLTVTPATPHAHWPWRTFLHHTAQALPPILIASLPRPGL